jgi:hypothetical protein
MPKEVDSNGRGTSGEHPALECQARAALVLLSILRVETSLFQAAGNPT